MSLLKLLSSIVLFVLVATAMSVSATSVNATSSTWPVEQRCIPEPVLPPADWSYPGTILMSGYAGIHGIQMDWETPHILAFFRKGFNGHKPILGGQLSSDGHWYAVPMGEVIIEPSFNSYWHIHGVRIYKMSDGEETIDFNLDEYQDLYRFYDLAYTYYPVEWLDNSSFVIGRILVHPFTRKLESARFDSQDGIAIGNYLSPDGTRAYKQGQGLYDFSDPQKQPIQMNLETVSWKRDSSGFIGSALGRLSYYSQNGELIEQIFDLNGSIKFKGRVSSRNDARWSPDDQRFAFNEYSPYSIPNLYIIDWQDHKIVDTCLSPMSDLVWSPDGTMLAYLAFARQNLKVIVVDLQFWTAYDVARHSGLYGTLGHPEMVGWRD